MRKHQHGSACGQVRTKALAQASLILAVQCSGRKYKTRLKKSALNAQTFLVSSEQPKPMVPDTSRGAPQVCAKGPNRLWCFGQLGAMVREGADGAHFFGFVGTA